MMENNLQKKYNVLKEYEKEISNTINNLNQLLIMQSDLCKWIKSDINKIEYDKAEKSSTNGVVIDYKTFSDIINILSFAVSFNLCDKEFVDNLIKKGINYENNKNIIPRIDNKQCNTNTDIVKQDIVKLNNEEQLDENEIIAKMIIEGLLKSLVQKK